MSNTVAGEPVTPVAMPAGGTTPEAPNVATQPFWAEWFAVAAEGGHFGILKIVGFDSVNAYGRVVYGASGFQSGLPIKVIPHAPAFSDGGPLQGARCKLFETVEDALEFAMSRGLVKAPEDATGAASRVTSARDGASAFATRHAHPM